MTEENSSIILKIPYELKTQLVKKAKASGFQYIDFLKLVIDRAADNNFVTEISPTFQTRIYLDKDKKAKIRGLVKKSETQRERWLLKALELAVEDE